MKNAIINGVFSRLFSHKTIERLKRGNPQSDIGNSSFDHYADEPDLVMLTGLNPFVVLSILSL